MPKCERCKRMLNQHEERYCNSCIYHESDMAEYRSNFKNRKTPIDCIYCHKPVWLESRDHCFECFSKIKHN